MSDEVLMTFKSHTEGKNADVRIYADRIEWDRRGRMGTGSKVVLGVATVGLSLAATGIRRDVDSEVIPVKSITSVVVERDGFRQKVTIICSGNTIVFRCSREEAEQVKKLVTDLMLGRPVGASRQPAAPADRADDERPIDRPPPRAPAGWYHDPSGKFDRRYFNGHWTEHVSNNGDGQTYIDPVPE
ncbi:MAG: DUF2510 domain-containing protein [Ilumatobacteraceae bacterium]